MVSCCCHPSFTSPPHSLFVHRSAHHSAVGPLATSRTQVSASHHPPRHGRRQRRHQSGYQLQAEEWRGTLLLTPSHVHRQIVPRHPPSGGCALWCRRDHEGSPYPRPPTVPADGRPRRGADRAPVSGGISSRPLPCYPVPFLRELCCGIRTTLIRWVDIQRLILALPNECWVGC